MGEHLIVYRIQRRKGIVWSAPSEALSIATDDYVKTRTDDTETLTRHEKFEKQFEETERLLDKFNPKKR
jgi:hypothetical protein